MHNKSQNIASECQLLLGLRLGFNNESILTLPVWKSILESKGDISKSLANETLKVHNLSKIHQKIQSLNVKDSVLQNFINKYNFAKIKKQNSQPVRTASPSNQLSSSAYAVKISKCKNLCNCSECSDIAKNNSFSHEAFEILSDKIVTINDLIKTCSQLLALTCPDEILKYYETLKSLDCTDAKNKLTFLFFQFLIWTLNKNKFTFEESQNKENKVTVSFIPYHISQNFEVKIEKGKFNIYNKQSISVDSLNTLKLEMDLLIGYSGQLNNLELKNKNLTLLNSPIFSGKISKCHS